MIRNEFNSKPDNINRVSYFVSNCDLANPKGGFDGLGGRVYDLVKQNFPAITLLDKVNPPIHKLEWIQSKIFRKLSIPSSFPAFSSARLSEISSLLNSKICSGEGFIFFHGATPWIYYEPSKRYFIFTDCSFETYINNYHKREQYSKNDIGRIVKAETKFLAKAEHVFFSSQWALEETKKAYSLKGENFSNINQGPLLETDDIMPTLPENYFLFISLDFKGKGGEEICRAFMEFNSVNKKFKLLIVGQKPPDQYLKDSNIEYLGYINKADVGGQPRLKNLYKKCLALLLFTQKDIAPVVIIEAGLNGCPTISNDHAAINEMIVNEEIGLVIEKTKTDLIGALLKISSMDQIQLLAMRNRVFEYFTNKYNWARSGETILSVIGRD
jgi:glycosyltransferase involved in cell wall biosynthesis